MKTSSSMLAALFSLLSLTAASPAPLIRRKTDFQGTGQVLFLSNCFKSGGASYGEFDLYNDVSDSFLVTSVPAKPSLTTVINPSHSVDYLGGGTFNTLAGADFDAIISIDSEDPLVNNKHVGNGKTTSYFWAFECFYGVPQGSSAPLVYQPVATTNCTAQIYCLQGPADAEDQ